MKFLATPLTNTHRDSVENIHVAPLCFASLAEKDSAALVATWSVNVWCLLGGAGVEGFQVRTHSEQVDDVNNAQRMHAKRRPQLDPAKTRNRLNKTSTSNITKWYPSELGRAPSSTF